LPTSDPYYPTVGDRKSAEIIGADMKPTPQWMLTLDEAKMYMPELPATAYHSHKILRERCAGVELVKAENIKHKMDLLAACREGIARKFPGRWNEVYEARMLAELRTINAKGFDDYFAMLCNMCRFAKESMLVGPARGSAAGS